jgi:predicted transcriptional regulator
MKEMHKLKPKVCDLLDQLVDGEPHSKEEVAEAIGSKINSTFAGLLTACKKANIITFDSKTIKLLPEMLKYA